VIKTAFLVMGVQSSGTRLLTRILMAGGCVGSGVHHQVFDTVEPTSTVIVMRRHYPTFMRPAWAKSENIITSLEAIGYSVRALIITRDWHSMTQSQLAAPHADSYEAAREMSQAVWRRIFVEMPANTDFMTVSYEALVQRPLPTIARIFDYLGLKQVHAIEAIADGNEKYYE